MNKITKDVGSFYSGKGTALGLIYVTGKLADELKMSISDIVRLLEKSERGK